MNFSHAIKEQKWVAGAGFLAAMTMAATGQAATISTAAATAKPATAATSTAKASTATPVKPAATAVAPVKTVAAKPVTTIKPATSVKNGLLVSATPIAVAGAPVSIETYLQSNKITVTSPFTGNKYTIDQIKDYDVMHDELERFADELLMGLEAKEYGMDTLVQGMDNVTSQMDWTQLMTDQGGVNQMGAGNTCPDGGSGGMCGMTCTGDDNGGSCGGNCTGKNTGTLCGGHCTGDGHGGLCGDQCTPPANYTASVIIMGAKPVTFKLVPEVAMDRFYNNYLENAHGTDYFVHELVTTYKARIIQNIVTTPIR